MQTDDVRIFLFNHRDHSFQLIAAISATNAFMNIIA
ncbi:hypothetical protein PM8797T_21048 [Gimesia maris DSM 8797]|nr:hypothetical protein PM8797T_21048 [Gimesia maris DSM 8797]